VNSFMSRFRMPAVFCAIIFVLCEAISRPFAEMGVCDEWSFVRTAQLLAQTGHVRYNGWAACMIGWQLYPAAVFLKLFGFSFMAARMSTFLVAVLTTFLIQRTFVRAGINEQNATIGCGTETGDEGLNERKSQFAEINCVDLHGDKMSRMLQESRAFT